MKKLLDTLCGVLAAAALFAIMVLTFFDVSGRKLMSTSVPGSLELTELLMVGVIFAGLPLVSLANEHVVFDSLDPWLPRWFMRVQQVIVDLLCAGLLLGLAWLMFIKAGQMREYGDITQVLKLPLGLFVYLISLLCALTALIHGMLIIQPVAHHHIGVDDTAGKP